MYGLKEAGKLSLSNLRVVSLLSSFGFHETTTPCLFRHVTRNISFVLVVDDFGVKYHSKVDFDYLVSCLSTLYHVKAHPNFSVLRYSMTGMRAHYPCPIPGMYPPSSVASALMVSARLLPPLSIPLHPTDPGPPSSLLGLTYLPQPLPPNLRSCRSPSDIFSTMEGALIAVYSLLPVLLLPNRLTLP
jgi:hypothetical protein